jgi:hypothetical protein
MAENNGIDPAPEIMAPMVIIEFFRDADPKIEQLHFYIALHAPKILYKIIAPSKKASQLFALHFWNVDTVQPSVPQFPCYQLGIDLIGLGEAFFSLSVNVSWIDYQGPPSIALKTTVRIITTATCFISGRDFMVGKVCVNISCQNLWLWWHGKRFSRKQIGRAVNFPATFVDVNANV